MRKINLLLFAIVSIIGFNPYAATPSIQVENPQLTNDQPPTTEEESKKSKYMEDTLIYYRFAQTVGRFPDPDSTTMYGIGIRRLPNSFFYGIDYSVYISSDQNLKADTIQGSLGYRIIWNNRFLPYAMIQAGSASLKDKSGVYGDASGLATTVDFGLDYLKYGWVKFSIGIRHTNMSFNSKTIPSSSFLDLYSVIGLDF